MAAENQTSSPMHGGSRTGLLLGAGAMVFVGSSVGVSATLSNAPLFTGQALRYAAACVILWLLARATGRRLVVPRRTEWLWLGALVALGLGLFNVALIVGGEHAEPALLGVAVACVPILLAVVGPLLARSAPDRRVLLAAVLVTIGAVLVQGGGRTDAQGVGWAVVVLLTEASFTLLAIPVIGRLGPWSLSVWTTGMAAVLLSVVGVVTEGPTATAHLTGRNLLALGYLAVTVTAIAFVLWYSSVSRIGADRAGLLTGIAPASAAVTGVILGEPLSSFVVWIGIGIVAVGLATGLRPRATPIPPAPLTP